MYKSLKDFVNKLEQENELIRIKEYVDPIYEIPEVIDRVSKEVGGGKALLFENTGSEYPLLANMMGSEKRISLALGVDNLNEISDYIGDLFKEITQERGSIADKLKLLPIMKDASKWFPKKYKGVAPCQEVIYKDVDLNRLPILKCWPDDGGRFITLPLVHTKDPNNGSRNVGMYRMQLFSKDTTGMHWHRHKTGARHFLDSKSSHFPIAVCLGGDPVYTYAATAPLPDGIDEYLLAGFLRNSPVKLTNCLTVDIQVPADCDFVIEGYIDKNEAFTDEGPFGDHTGFYSPIDKYPLFHVTSISHKKDAIFPATLVGIPPQEDKYIALATEKIFSAPIKFTMVPEMEDFFIPEEGIGHNLAIVKIKKSYPGQAIKVAHSLWGAGQMMFNKIIIVVDSAVNIRNWDELFNCIKENYLPKSDTHFSRGPLDVLDHSAPVCGFGGKLLIDATVKSKEERLVSSSINNKEALKFIYDERDADALLNILIDKEFKDLEKYYLLWLWGSNYDPIRDSRFLGDLLVMDATTKSSRADGSVREWPKFALSSKEVIESIDKKWSKLGLGEFKSSPSLLFSDAPRSEEKGK